MSIGIGSYAVGYYGYPRATANVDIWIAVHHQNAARLVNTLEESGFELTEELFLHEIKLSE